MLAVLMLPKDKKSHFMLVMNFLINESKNSKLLSIFIIYFNVLQRIRVFFELKIK